MNDNSIRYIHLEFDSEEEAHQFKTGEFKSVVQIGAQFVILMTDAVWVIDREHRVKRVIS